MLRPALPEWLEPISDFFVSMPTRTVLRRRTMSLFSEAGTGHAAPAGILDVSGRGDRPRGVERLTFELDKDGERRRKMDQPGVAVEASDKTQSKKKSRPPEIGSALRSVYQRTVDESIPPEMLDLLGKLG